MLVELLERFGSVSLHACFSLADPPAPSQAQCSLLAAGRAATRGAAGGAAAGAPLGEKARAAEAAMAHPAREARGRYWPLTAFPGVLCARGRAFRDSPARQPRACLRLSHHWPPATGDRPPKLLTLPLTITVTLWSAAPQVRPPAVRGRCLRAT